jgi:hypothetical protein
MIVFGGRDTNGNNLNDVWVLTNANGLGGTAQWINLIANGAAGSPPARSGHSAAYDSVNNIMIIFGGCSGFCIPALNDTWTLSNANGLGGTPVWTELMPTFGAGNGPAARTNSAAGYDQSNNRLLIYSGQDGSANPCSTFSDVWLLTNANGLGSNPSGWAESDPLVFSNTPSDTLPGLNGAGSVYDPAGGGLTVFGGKTIVEDVCQATNGVWGVFSNLFTSFYTLIPEGAAGSPPARSFASLVHDATGGRMLVFGGTNTAGTDLNDVWALSSGVPIWSKLGPSGMPPAARTGQAAIFDSANQRMTIFAGSNTSGVLNDVWVLTAPGVSPLSCNTNAGSPNIVRAEGIAEQVGDLILNCTGGIPTPLGERIPEYEVTMTLNTNITSRALPEGAKLSEALLTIDEPLPADPVPFSFLTSPGQPPQILCKPLGSTCAETGTGGSPSPYQTQPNVFVGKQTSHKTLQWNVPIDPPGIGITRVIRLTNTRANASGLGVSNTFIPTQLQATVAVQGTAPVPVGGAQQVLGLVQPALDPPVPLSNPIPQCTPHNASLLGRSSTVAAFDFTTQITESYGYVFEYRNYGTFISGLEFPAPLSEQNIPGFEYRTETGFYSPSLFTSTPTLGLADFGTRVHVTFAPVPAGVRLFVPATITMTGNYGEGTPSGQLQLIQADQNGLSSPGYEPVMATAMVGTTPVAEATAVGSSAYATYEILYADPSVTETVTIPVAVAFKNSPATGQANVTSSLAPLNATATDSATAPVPRFTSIYAAQPAFAIDSCSAFEMSASIASKTGPQNARVWTLDVNSGVVASTAAQIESFTLTQSSGPKCTPSINSPSFPDSLGDIPANASSTVPVTIDFTGCSSSSKFTVVVALSANGGASNTTVALRRQEF